MPAVKAQPFTPRPVDAQGEFGNFFNGSPSTFIGGSRLAQKDQISITTLIVGALILYFSINTVSHFQKYAKKYQDKLKPKTSPRQIGRTASKATQK
jgi:hypothetical protein